MQRLPLGLQVVILVVVASKLEMVFLLRQIVQDEGPECLGFRLGLVFGPLVFTIERRVGPQAKLSC